jgi:hypothetical protein
MMWANPLAWENPLIWEPWGSYAMRTETHSIARCRVKGAAIYVLWELPEKRLGKFRNFLAAKTAAENQLLVEMET